MPLYFLLAAALVAVDQVVKYLVRQPGFPSTRRWTSSPVWT